MGRPKFPGKPSKLVTKKRVSVLNGAATAAVGATAAGAPPPTPATNSAGHLNGLVSGGGQQSTAVPSLDRTVTNDNIEPDGDIGLRTPSANVTKSDAVQVSFSTDFFFLRSYI